MVVIAFSKKLDGTIVLLVYFDYAMHNWNISAFDAEDSDVASANRIALQVTTMRVAQQQNIKRLFVPDSSSGRAGRRGRRPAPWSR